MRYFESRQKTRSAFPPKRVALVHEWFETYAGSERVVEQILNIYPDAEIFSVVDFLEEKQRGFIRGKKAKTTFIQHFPLARSHFRHYLPLMPFAIEQLDLSGFDLVISSHHAVAKGIITHAQQLHISYVHTPIRYAWDLYHQYIRETDLNRGAKGWLAKSMLHYLRMWDSRTANGVDDFVANSRYVARRVEKVYNRRAKVIYPPVDVHKFQPGTDLRTTDKEEFYLTASRMVPYKKIDLIVEAFAAMPEKRLLVIGDGPEYPKIKQKAAGNITFLGHASAPVLVETLQKAKAFIFAAEEDFGIMPVEAQACGTPVIAYGKGGVLESIRGLDFQTPTGVFFEEQTAGSLQEAVRIFEKNQEAFSPQSCRGNAMRFSNERFQKELHQHFEQTWESFQCKIKAG